MRAVSKNKLGLVVGSFFGLWHLSWSFLVALGFAQILVNFLFRLHFIQPPYTVTPFRFGVAVTLIVITFTVGYLVGWLLGASWNLLHPADQYD